MRRGSIVRATSGACQYRSGCFQNRLASIFSSIVRRGSIPAPVFIIDHTTTAPAPTAERIARWAGWGKVFIHAPVFMAPSLFQLNYEQERWKVLSFSDVKDYQKVLQPA